MQSEEGEVEGRWLVVTSHPDEALAFCRRNLDGEPTIVTFREMLGEVAGFRSFLSDRNIHKIAVYSENLENQVMPQAIELLLGLSGACDRVVIDGRSGRIQRIRRFHWLGTVARLPFEVAQAGALAVRESAKMLQRGRHQSGRHRSSAAVLQAGSEVEVHRRGRTFRSSPWILAIMPARGDLLIGGAVTHASGIFAGFRAAGYKVALLTTTAIGEQIASAVDEFVMVSTQPRSSRITLGMQCLGFNQPLREAAFRFTRHVRPALIYQRCEYLATAGADVAEALDVPLVLEWNSSPVWTWRHRQQPSGMLKLAPELTKRLAPRFERQIIDSASLIVAVSEQAAAMAYEAGASHDSVLVLPNGVDVGLIDAAMDKARGKPGISPAGIGRGAWPSVQLGWVGSFGHWHGTDVLIRAMALLPPEVRAVMIGTGDDLASNRALARDLDVDERIDFTGELPHAEAIARLGTSDLLVSPHVDNFGRPFFGSPTKIFEYMAIGMPIVASKLEQIGEVLEDGVTARLVPPGDVQALADAIVSVFSSEDHGARLGTNARRVAEERHTWASRAASILDAVGAPRGAVVQSGLSGDEDS